jgi:hypothetical protein
MLRKVATEWACTLGLPRHLLGAAASRSCAQRPLARSFAAGSTLEDQQHEIDQVRCSLAAQRPHAKYSPSAARRPPPPPPPQHRRLHPAAASCLPLPCCATTAQINDLFVEARDEIEFAKEDAGTTYFNESCEEARALVAGVLGRFEGVLGVLGEEERGRLQRSMGMKMEQLKAEVGLLDTLHDD